MAFFVTIIILLVIVAAMITSLVFANKGAADITKIKINGKSSWKNSEELKSAHRLLTWLSVAGWITIALVIVGIIMFFVFGGEAVEGAEEAKEVEQPVGKKKKGSFITDVVMFLAAAATLTIGIMGVLAARNINAAQADTANGISPDDPAWNTAYEDTIICASIGIGTVGIIVILFIIRACAKHSAKKVKITAEKEKKEAEKEKIDELEEQKETFELEKQQELEEKRQELLAKKKELDAKKKV